MKYLSLVALTLAARACEPCANTQSQTLTACRQDFGTSTAATQLRAFSSAGESFSTQAAEIDTSLRSECRAIALDLGATEGELARGNVPRNLHRGLHRHVHGSMRRAGVRLLLGRVPRELQRRVHRAALYGARCLR